MLSGIGRSGTERRWAGDNKQVRCVHVEIVTGETCSVENKAAGRDGGWREDRPRRSDCGRAIPPQCSRCSRNGSRLSRRSRGSGLGQVPVGHKPMQRLTLACLRDRKKTGMAGGSPNKLATGWEPPD